MVSSAAPAAAATAASMAASVRSLSQMSLGRRKVLREAEHLVRFGTQVHIVSQNWKERWSGMSRWFEVAVGIASKNASASSTWCA